MKKTLLLLIACLCYCSANAQIEMEQVAMNNLLIISNRGNFPPNGTDIKRHRFEYDEWAIADLSISNFKNQAVVIYKFQAVNKFGEIVPKEEPSETKVFAYDKPQNDYYSVYDVSVSKEDLTTMYFDQEKSWGMDHQYIIMLPDETASVMAYYNKDGSKEYDFPIAVDKDKRIKLYGKESINYNDNNNISQFSFDVNGEPVLDWIWEDQFIIKAKLKQYTTIWEKNIEVLEKYDNGLWKRVKVSEYQGSTKNEDKTLQKSYFLERRFFGINK